MEGATEVLCSAQIEDVLVILLEATSPSKNESTLVSFAGDAFGGSGSSSSQASSDRRRGRPRPTMVSGALGSSGASAGCAHSQPPSDGRRWLFLAQPKSCPLLEPASTGPGCFSGSKTARVLACRITGGWYPAILLRKTRCLRVFAGASRRGAQARAWDLEAGGGGPAFPTAVARPGPLGRFGGQDGRLTAPRVRGPLLCSKQH